LGNFVFVIGGLTSHCTEDDDDDDDEEKKKMVSPTVPPLSMELMLTLASQAALITAKTEILWAIHQDDFAPDITESMLSRRCTQIEALAMNYGQVEIVTPFVKMTKAQVFELGIELAGNFGINLLDDTYSCSSGTGVACGHCRQCQLRQQAFVSLTVPA
jgi:7-cyano-7-deazaguanine synthase in queuosine biosynthesis